MSKVCISFDCPKTKKFSTPNNRVFECSLCQKKVYDFTHMDVQEFSKTIPEIQEKYLCGIYRPDQVETSSKLRWFNKVNLKYISYKTLRPYAVRTLVLGCLIFLISSCSLGKSNHIVGQLPAHSV